MSSPALRRIETLGGVALRLARTTPSGRLALARLADAVDPAWLPAPGGDALAADLATASAAARKPLSGREVERVLRSAWGARPSEELDELEAEPAAVTPAAQVHRATLGGEPVAVKVLRPGVAATVRRDLTSLEALVRPLAAAFPAIDPSAVLGELRARVVEELDLEHEAEVQRRFHRALRDHPAFVVPAPVMRLAHPAVLVTAWVDGVPLREAADPDAAAERLVMFVVGSGRFGVVHADPDPDDVLVLADGRVAVLDFGATRVVDPARMDHVADALDAVAEGDGGALGAALGALGWLPAGDGQAALELAHHGLGELAGSGPARLDAAAVVAARDRVLARRDDLAALVVAAAPPPADLWPARALGQLGGALARTGATAAWLPTARAAARDGWAAAR